MKTLKIEITERQRAVLFQLVNYAKYSMKDLVSIGYDDMLSTIHDELIIDCDKVLSYEEVSETLSDILNLLDI